MKVETKNIVQPESFKPFQLVFTIETEKEAGALYGLFNYSRICDVLRYSGIEPNDIRPKIKEGFGERHLDDSEFFSNARKVLEYS